MKKLYFAFGSNMLTERIQARVGKVRCLGAFGVMGWELAFNAGDGRKCFANLIKSADGSKIVMGVLYEVTSVQMRSLDTCEGAPYFYTRMVIDRMKGKDVFAYVSINPMYTQQADRKVYPALDYVNLMIAGYEQHKLPTEAEYLREHILPLTKTKHGVMW